MKIAKGSNSFLKLRTNTRIRVNKIRTLDGLEWQRKIVKVVNVTDAIYEKIKVVEEELKTAKSEYYLLSGKTWNQKIFGGTIHRGFIRVVCFYYGVVFLVRGIADRYLEIHFNIFSVLIGAGLLYVVYLSFPKRKNMNLVNPRRHADWPPSLRG